MSSDNITHLKESILSLSLLLTHAFNYKKVMFTLSRSREEMLVCVLKIFIDVGGVIEGNKYAIVLGKILEKSQFVFV